MISFGPTICYPHSPDEKVEIASVGKFYDFLTDTLRHIPESSRIVSALSEKWFVIVNPVAGGGRGLDHFPQFRACAKRTSCASRSSRSIPRHELTVTAVRKGYRRIIVVGGHGTLHEVVNGLFIQQTVRPDEVLLAVVAWVRGTTGRTFGISSRYQDAVKAIAAGCSFLQDVGVVSYEESHYRQSRYMANVAGGVSTRMSCASSHLKKKGLGSRWRYTWCVVKLLPLQVDGHQGVGRRPAGLQ